MSAEESWSQRHETMGTLTDEEQLAYVSGIAQAFDWVFRVITEAFESGGDLHSAYSAIHQEWERIEAEMKVRGIL